MGMFDWISLEIGCPKCGCKVSGFQSKDMESPQCNRVEFKEVDNFYTDCDGCGGWIEFNFNLWLLKRREDRTIDDYSVSIQWDSLSMVGIKR